MDTQKLEQSVSAFERLLESRGYSLYERTRISISYEAQLALAYETNTGEDDIKSFKRRFNRKFKGPKK